MKRFGIFLLLAERIPRDWYECRRAEWQASDCIAMWRVKTVSDSMWLFQAFNPPERPGPAPETPQAKENYATAAAIERAFTPQGVEEERRRKAAEVKAYWAEYERRMRAPVAAPPVYAPLPVYAPETFEPSAPDSFQHPANKTRQRANAGQPRHIYGDQREPTSATSTRLGNTITTEISDGRTCTTTLLGGTATTECY